MSVALWTAACCTSSTDFSIVGPSIDRHIVLCVYCSTFNFSWSDRVSWHASSIHGCNLALRRASFLYSSSICDYSFLPSCNHMRRWVGAKVCTVSQTSSYLCYVSLIYVCIICKNGSSCKFIHNSRAWSNIIASSVTVISNVPIFSLIAAPRCSRTFGGVVGCNSSRSS